MGKGLTKELHDGAGLRVGVVSTRWNKEIIDTLKQRCRQGLLDSNVAEQDIVMLDVPGSYELPFGVKHLLQKGNVDAVVAIGVLIKGETMHFEYIAEATTHGLMQLNIEYDKPVIFGVLTCLSEEQAEYRAKEDGLDHGYEWGLGAVEMGLLRKR